ncbi:proteophosphoglycan ppg4 [Variovorax arabinosiphilus]|uniref:proteophosphoglycan ppg4 n=1 Tax=Variovorax arabinosiphilus TaxID=3053498 RepID=UPI002578FF15|nr:MULTISPECIES: proteophosphoglycan ppg4 [unclassified Variovorax]MDM0122026.1 proteophosphoglycan ppg4 [Variovorax sp. J2L1-78]MDM0131444.1 proteophosphoglycan ppg4 [Variovorax sp. J2L1-63]MDM0234789.1 proteophosphoglycan ppg4 [Variovorax sp. J2R1-6]
MIKRTAPLLAALLMGAAGVAMAQGNPPNPNVSNPAIGAGQQTQQGTPMGTTGTPTATPGAAPMNSGTTTTPAQAPNAPAEPAMRPARADRN